mmetsp:Transcript_132942/g.187858  ORF Transcript_132942/g.187858 Transcript_132942/m.187858 type:complete len:229 (+) Transcript_132942:25-711(+)
MSLLPPIKWAQRKDSVYVTIDVPDVKDEQISLKDTTLSFKGKSGDRTYELELEFFAELDPSHEKSIYSVKPRNVHFHIMKKDQDEEYWPRLLKNKALEKTNVKLDWDKYVDEDEEDGGFDTAGMGGGMNFADMMGQGGMGGAGMGGMDMSSLMGAMGGAGGAGGMGGMGGAGGMGGMDMSALMGAMGGAGGMGGMGDMGGDNAADSDDEEDNLDDLDGPTEGSLDDVE